MVHKDIISIVSAISKVNPNKPKTIIVRKSMFSYGVTKVVIWFQ